MVVPALPAAWALGRLLEADWIEATASAFAISVASAGLASIIAFVMGRGFTTVALLHVGFLVALDVALVLAARNAGAPRLGFEAIPSAWIAGIGLVAVLQRPWLAPNVDAWYHLAAARSLLFTGGSIVTDPFFGLGSKFVDPTSGALHVLLGLTSKYSGQDVSFLWGGLNVFGAMLLASALWSLFRQLGAERRHALGAMLAVVFLAMSADLRFTAYPNQLGLAILILALVGFAGAVRGRKDAWVLAMLGSFAASAIHMGVATAMVAITGICIVGLVVFAFFTRGRGRGASVPWPERSVWLTALGMFVASAAAFAPRLWYLMRDNVSGSLAADSGATVAVQSVYRLFGLKIMFHPDSTLGGGDLMLLFGTAMAVLCLIEGARRRDRLMALAGIIGFVPIVVGYNPIITPALLGFSPYASYRLLAFMWFAPWVAVAVGWRNNPLLARLAIIGALLGVMPTWHTMFTEEPPVAIRSGVQNISVVKGWERDVTHIAGAEALDELRVALGDEWPMVATDDLTGYALAGLANVHVYAVPQVHSPSAFERLGTGELKRRALAVLMSPVTPYETRLAIVRDTDADYVLLWPGRVADNARVDMIADTETFDVAYNRGGIVLLKVRGR